MKEFEALGTLSFKMGTLETQPVSLAFIARVLKLKVHVGLSVLSAASRMDRNRQTFSARLTHKGCTRHVSRNIQLNIFIQNYAQIKRFAKITLAYGASDEVEFA